MPKINVYVPDELAEEIKDLSLPISAICQKALEQAAGATRKKRSRRGGGMFRRFDGKGRDVVVTAQEEAIALDHHYIGTEHLLLAMLGHNGVATAVLSPFGILQAGVRAQVLATIGRGTTTPSGHVPFTAKTKKAMELALRESLALGDDFIGEEHFVLALARMEEGFASELLREHGVQHKTIREQIVALRTRARAPEPTATEAIDKAEIELVPLLEARLDRLKAEVSDQLRALRTQVEQEQERSQQLWKMLGAQEAPEPKRARPVLAPSSALRCSFCGKSQKAVDKLIAGPGVYICSECIDLCSDIVEKTPPGA